jgi:hypothetical protein
MAANPACSPAVWAGDFLLGFFGFTGNLRGNFPGSLTNLAGPVSLAATGITFWTHVFTFF